MLNSFTSDVHIHGKEVQHAQHLCQVILSPRVGRDILSVDKGLVGGVALAG